MATYKKWTSTVLVNGQPEPNVKVYVYEPGTTNEIPIYEDEGVTQITQPILTDSQGRYAFFVDVDAYPEIRLYLEKDGVDFSEVNEDLDGVPVPGAGAGAGTFLALSDTPSDYVGRGGDVVVVKTTEDGIETQPWPVTGTVLNVFLSSDAADIGDYYYMYHTETGDTHSEFTSPSLSTGNDQLLWSFVTEAGQPGLNQLALGAYTATLFLKKSGNKDVRVYWKLFKRDTSGNETEILESAVSDHLTTDNSQYLISAYLNEDQILDPTDRLVLKLFANVSGTGTDVTVTLTMEGDYDSRLAIHVLSSAFNLDRLSDVTVSSPSDDEVLAYDSGSSKWLNKAPTFLKLVDTPSSFAGKAGYSPVVNEAENALEFAKRAAVTESDMDIYVDATNGDDSTGDGTSSNPYATINRAIRDIPDLIAHKVVVRVADGTYRELVSIRNKLLTTPDASLTFEGNPTTPSNCRVTGSEATADTTPARRQVFLITNCTQVTLNGFLIDYGGADVAGDGGRANIYVENSKVILKNIEIKNGERSGLQAVNSRITLGDGPKTDTNACTIDSNGWRGVDLDACVFYSGASNFTNNSGRGLYARNSFLYVEGTSSSDATFTGNSGGYEISYGSSGLFIHTEIGNNSDYGAMVSRLAYVYSGYANIAAGANGTADLRAEHHGILQHANDDATLSTSTDTGTGSIIYS